MVKEVEDKEEGMEQAKEMAKRLQVRVLKLEEELREARRRVEVSEEEGRRMRKRVGGKEGEKLEEQGKEVANVTLLLLGLTRRLAKLEVEGHEGVGGGKTLLPKIFGWCKPTWNFLGGVEIELQLILYTFQWRTTTKLQSLGPPSQPAWVA